VFRGIDKRLTGIGVISVYSSYVFSFYYNVVVAWSLVYVCAAFANPLPYSASIPKEEFPCNNPGMSRAEQFYRYYVIRFVTEVEGAEVNCRSYDETKDASVMSGYALGATFATWVLIFLCIFKGV